MSQAYRQLFDSKDDAAEYLEQSLEEIDQFGNRSYDADDNLQKVVADGVAVEVVEQGDQGYGYDVSTVDGAGQVEESKINDLVP